MTTKRSRERLKRRRLDQELVRRRLVPSREAAKRAVESGQVLIDGMPASKPSSLVAAEDAVVLTAEPQRFVSRGGDKLEGALEAFDLDVAGANCLDVGASTGGFTDVLLQRGAAHVVALDVGYGQLAWSLRSDERVTVVERTNVRHADIAALGGPFDVVVADLSFISLATVAPALGAATTPDGNLVLLVKPQFEAGRDEVGRGGVVKDPAVHRASIMSAATAMDAEGFGAVAVTESSLQGPAGNREFLLWCSAAGTGLDATALEEVAS